MTRIRLVLWDSLPANYVQLSDITYVHMSTDRYPSVLLTRRPNEMRRLWARRDMLWASLQWDDFCQFCEAISHYEDEMVSGLRFWKRFRHRNRDRLEMLLWGKQMHGMLTTNQTKTVARTVRTRTDGEYDVGGHQWTVIDHTDIEEHANASWMTGHLQVMGEVQQNMLECFGKEYLC